MAIDSVAKQLEAVQGGPPSAKPPKTIVFNIRRPGLFKGTLALPEDGKIRTQKDFVRYIKEQQVLSLRIVDRKNTDYTGSPDPFSNFREHGTYGILVRMRDKLSRLTSLCRSGRARVTDESFADTARDLANYSLIAIAYQARVPSFLDAFESTPQARRAGRQSSK